jgi:GNAT superfamily N-acetyltransferase
MMTEPVRVIELSGPELEQALDGIAHLFAGDLTDSVRGVLRHYATDDDCVFLVGHSGSVVAGFLSGYFPVTMDYEGRVGRIDVLLVHHEWRQRGVGRALLDEFRTRARARGCRHLLADVPIREGRETAKGFWTASGFHETDIHQFWAEV